MGDYQEFKQDTKKLVRFGLNYLFFRIFIAPIITAIIWIMIIWFTVPHSPNFHWW